MVFMPACVIKSCRRPDHDKLQQQAMKQRNAAVQFVADQFQIERDFAALAPPFAPPPCAGG